MISKEAIKTLLAAKMLYKPSSYEDNISIWDISIMKEHNSCLDIRYLSWDLKTILLDKDANESFQKMARSVWIASLNVNDP